MIDSYDLAGFYGRGTVLHTGLEYAYQQFDHDLKRKGLLILYSNGLSQSEAGFQTLSKIFTLSDFIKCFLKTIVRIMKSWTWLPNIPAQTLLQLRQIH